MSGLARALPTIAAVGAVSVVLWPLLGLWSGVADPPPARFTEPPALAELVTRSGTLALLVRTLALAAVVSIAALPLGAVLGYVEQRIRLPGNRWLSVLTLIPLAMPSYLLASCAREALGPGGFLAGFQPPVFAGFWAAALVLTVITVPFVQLLVSATLARSSASETEAARTLGASHVTVLRRLVLPTLRPTLALGILLVQLYVVSDFGAVAVLDCPVLTWRLYQAVNHQQLGEASVMAIGLLVVTVPLFVAARWVHGAGDAMPFVPNPRPVARRELPPLARSLVYVCQGLVVVLGVLVPLVTLVVWIVDGVRHGATFAAPWVPLRDTFLVAIAGTSVTLAVAFAPAWVAARHRRRAVRNALERATYLTSALPGVLLAFGLLLGALSVTRGMDAGGAYAWLLGSGALLMIGYVIRFVAEAYAALKPSILALDARLEDAARVLGASPWRWFTGIAWRRITPGVVAAWVLVFLAVAKELPVTLLLGGAMGLRTLSFRVYDRYEEALLHDAGLAGLVLVVLALAAVTVTLRWRQHV